MLMHKYLYLNIMTTMINHMLVYSVGDNIYNFSSFYLLVGYLALLIIRINTPKFLLLTFSKKDNHMLVCGVSDDN